MSTERTITLRVNGRTERASFPAHRTLLEALRQTGHMEVKCGCEKGDCGACAVLVDGMAVDSCLTLAWTVEGAEITTVSGLGDPRCAAPGAAGVRRRRRRPVRLLHPRASSSPQRRSSTRTPEPDRGRHPPRPERQPVPLHRATTKVFEAVERGGRRHAGGEGRTMRGASRSPCRGGGPIAGGAGCGRRRAGHRCAEERTMSNATNEFPARPNIRFRQVGKPLTRTDAPGKVTGRTPYAGDYEDARHAAHAGGARGHRRAPGSSRLDVSRARALEGVACVLTADGPSRPHRLDRHSGAGRPASAWTPASRSSCRERVRYFGEPLALIAAESARHRGPRHGADRVRASSPSPGVYDPLEAMKPGAPGSSPGPTTSWRNAGSGRADVEAGFRRKPTSWSRTRSALRSRSTPSWSRRWGSRGWTRTTWSTSASPPR